MGSGQGEIFAVRVERLGAGGAGMASHRGMRVFIDMTAPGELVRARMSETHRDWGRGELVEIEEPSPLRIKAACPLYGHCGGCSLQHLSYETQLAEKKQILADSFRRVGNTEPPEPKIFPSPPWEYRNRMQFHCIKQFHSIKQFHRTKQSHSNKSSSGGTLGFKARKSEDLVSVTDCPVADPGIRSALGEGRLSPPVEKDRFTVYSRGGTFLSEGGERRGRVRLLDKELELEAGVFFQSNGGLLELLIRRLEALAEEADRNLPLADLYCGVGTFASFLAERFPRTDLVEENPAALALARQNLRGKEAAFYASSADAWVKNRAFSRGPYGFMVLDPPRTGLSPALRNWILQEGPPLLAYVSCDPATAARDSREILAGNYELTELELYDFYPQTAHIESLAVFKRTKGKSSGL